MDPASYGLSTETGFCLEEPLTELPPQFSIWHELASSMPDLIEQGIVRQRVNEMPLLDTSALTSRREKFLANMQLTFIASGYVWGCGDDNIAKSIPACLAVPFHTLSQQLGVQPSHCSPNRTLANWTRIDPDGPISWDNVRILYPFLGGREDVKLFTKVMCMSELEFGPAIQPLVTVLAAVDAEDEDVIAPNLNVVTQCVKNMETTLCRVNDMHVYSFLYRIGVYIRGWNSMNIPDSDGLIFEGVSDTPIKTADDSGGQNGAIMAVNALLGINLSAEEHRQAFQRLRNGLLPEHKSFIDTIEQRPKSLQDFVAKSKNKELREAYNQCVNQVASFRSKHIQLFAKYFIIASKKKEKEAESKGEQMPAPNPRDIIEWLKSVRDDTLRANLSDNVP